MWEPKAPTYFHTHSHTHTVHYKRILMKNKVYRYITDWMILISFYYWFDWLRGAYIYLPTSSLPYMHVQGTMSQSAGTNLTLGRAKMTKSNIKMQ